MDKQNKAKLAAPDMDKQNKAKLAAPDMDQQNKAKLAASKTEKYRPVGSRQQADLPQWCRNDPLFKREREITEFLKLPFPRMIKWDPLNPPKPEDKEDPNVMYYYIPQ